MIPIKEITDLPPLNWSDQAKAEMQVFGCKPPAGTALAWQLGEYAVCGLVYTSFTSPPWFWFALADGVGLRQLIDFRRLVAYLPRGTATAVMEDFEEGRRFAEVYGFMKTDQVVNTGGLVYRIYKRS